MLFKQKIYTEIKARNLMNLRNENAAEFFFLLDQKLKSIPNKMSAKDLVCQIIQTIMQCVKRFNPGNENFNS